MKAKARGCVSMRRYPSRNHRENNGSPQHCLIDNGKSKRVASQTFGHSPPLTKKAHDVKQKLCRTAHTWSHLGISVISLAHTVGSAVRGREETRNDKDSEVPTPLVRHPPARMTLATATQLVHQGLESRIGRPQASHHPDTADRFSLPPWTSAPKGRVVGLWQLPPPHRSLFRVKPCCFFPDWPRGSDS